MQCIVGQEWTCCMEHWCYMKHLISHKQFSSVCRWHCSCTSQIFLVDWIHYFLRQFYADSNPTILPKLYQITLYSIAEVRRPVSRQKAVGNKFKSSVIRHDNFHGVNTWGGKLQGMLCLLLQTLPLNEVCGLTLVSPGLIASIFFNQCVVLFQT